jgi:hypothetical protein
MDLCRWTQIHNDLVYITHKQTGSNRLRQIELKGIIRYQAYIDAMELPNAVRDNLYSGPYIRCDIRALPDNTQYYVPAIRGTEHGFTAPETFSRCRWVFGCKC